MVEMVFPAATETTTVSGPQRPTLAVNTWSNICGLTASMTMSGAKPAGAATKLATPCSAIICAMAGGGDGSRTVMLAAGVPPLSQPLNMAPPILPAPTSAMVKSVFPVEFVIAIDCQHLRPTSSRSLNGQQEFRHCPAFRTRPRQALPAPSCQPTPRTGMPGNTARKPQAHL